MQERGLSENRTMSVDAWGGGSDQDPKLRLKEVAERQRSKQQPSEKKNDKPEVSLWDLILLGGLIAVICFAVVHL